MPISLDGPAGSVAVAADIVAAAGDVVPSGGAGPAPACLCESVALIFGGPPRPPPGAPGPVGPPPSIDPASGHGAQDPRMSVVPPGLSYRKAKVRATFPEALVRIDDRRERELSPQGVAD